MKNSVLDSSALLAFLFDEPGADQLDEVLAAASRDEHAVFMSVVNWAEVQYKMIRKRGPDAWQKARQQLLALPIQVVDADQTMAEMAAGFKVSHNLALADAFAAALAKQKKATLLTRDKDFKPAEGEIKIGWL